MLKKRKEEACDDIELTGEDNVDDTDLEVMEEKSSAKVAELKKKLSESEEARRTLLEDLQRAKADFLNARKRIEEERVSDRTRALVAHINELLPLCDSFDAALNMETLNNVPENLQKGLRGIKAQLSSLLASYKVVTLGTVGESFDPTLHEAVDNVPVSDTSSDHRIIAVVQKGYKMDDTLIRPARVTVGIYQKE